MSSIRRNLEQRAQEAILKNIVENYKKNRKDWKNNPTIRQALFNKAFFNPANALLIGGAIVSSGCLSLLVAPALALGAGVVVLAGLLPLVLGLAAEAFYLVRAINDEEAHVQAVADMLRQDVNFEPKSLHDKDLQAKVDKALEYWSLIDDSVGQVSDGPLRERLENTTREVTHWLQAVYNLAGRVDKFRLNKVVKQDLQTVPRAIADYKAKLALEDSPEVQRQLEKTIGDMERQLRILQSLEDNMEKAEYQLESTISSLGTIYSQLLLVGSKDEAGNRVNRLQEEISEQVHRLEDLTEAMDEVYESSY